MNVENLTQELKELRLNGILNTYLDYALIADREKKSYEAFLYDLVKEESEQRRIKRINRLKKESKIPVPKVVEDYDFNNVKGITSKDFDSLARGDFLKESFNIVFYGSYGLGKTHLAIALVQKLCELNYKCLYTRTSDLIESLVVAKKELKSSDLWRRLDRYDLIVCDELGYIPQSRDGADLFFQLISQRYERKSLIITTNLPYSQWGEVFLNDTTTAAAVDRIIHRCKTYSLTGESRRVTEAKTRSGE